MDYCHFARSSSFQDSLKVIEADIQNANMLAAAIPRAKDGSCLRMKLVYNQLATIFIYLLQWIDCSCTCMIPSCLNLFHIAVYKVCPDAKQVFTSYARKATIREFYGVILPSLQRLHDNSLESHVTEDKVQDLEIIDRKKVDKKRKNTQADLEKEDECGICLEPCTKMVLPNCCHAMCVNCYHDWNIRSESCPFCRGSIKRVKSEDLWVLTCSEDVIDQETASKEDMLRFYLYISSLPKDIPDALFLVYYEYLI